MRRLELYVIAVASILVTSFEKSFAIRCWTCNSEIGSEGFCDDPFDSTTIYRQNRRWSYVECTVPPQNSQYSPYSSGYGSYSNGGYNSGYNNNNGYNAYNSYGSYGGSNGRLRPVCQKAVHRIDGRIFVHRKCAWVNDFDPVDKCMLERTPSYIQREFCEFCEEDGCNGAIAYGPITLLVAASAALKILLF